MIKRNIIFFIKGKTILMSTIYYFTVSCFTLFCKVFSVYYCKKKKQHRWLSISYNQAKEGVLFSIMFT